MSVIRTVLVISLVLSIARIALGLPIMSSVMSSTLPTECPAVGSGAVVTDYSNLSWQGRTLSLSELGCTYSPVSLLSLGAAYRDSNGHGNYTSYAAHGWEAWTSLHLLAERGQRPDLSLNAQVVHESMTMQEQTWMLDSLATPRATTHGVDLCAGKHIGPGYGQVDAGVYDVSLFGEQQATLWALGAAYHQHFTRSVEGQVALAGYRDDFNGGTRHTYDLVVGVRAGRVDKPYLALSATYFPCGIPLAGTPLSTAAMAGAFYANSATGTLSLHAFGYVSVEAGIPF